MINEFEDKIDEEKDEEYIKGWDVIEELFELDKELPCEAFEIFFNIFYPVKLQE